MWSVPAEDVQSYVVQGYVVLEYRDQGLLQHVDKVQLNALQEKLKQCLEWLVTAEEVKGLVEERAEMLKFLANMYAQGKFGTVQDIEVAFKYRLEAADLGDAEAAALAGMMYLDGYNYLIREGLEKEQDEYEDYRGSAFDQGSVLDRFALEEHMKYNEATGTWSYDDPRSKRRRLAEQKRREKAATKQRGPQKPPGVSLRNSNVKLKENKKLAVPYLKIAARNGNTMAQIILSQMYSSGEGIEANMKKAVQLLQMAAAQNDPTALFDLGQFYYNGVNVSIDANDTNQEWDEFQDKAGVADTITAGSPTTSTINVEHERESEGQDQSSDSAAAAVAAPNDSCSTEGEKQYVPFVIEKDIPRAVEYFERAAQLGHTPSNFWLGHAYFQGQGVPQDKRRGIMHLKSAMKDNHPGAIFYIGLMYKNGDMLTQDNDKWEKCFRKAVQLKWGPALYMLADIYYHGKKGREKNFKKAFQYYAEAGDTGHADALYCLGTMFFNGEGTERDLKRAYYAYSQAAGAGSKHAMLAIASMALKGEGIPKDENYARHILEVAKTMTSDGDMNGTSAQQQQQQVYQDAVNVQHHVVRASS